MTRFAPLTLALTLLILAAPLRADDAAELQKLRAENAALRARVAELEKQVESTHGQVQQLTTEKQALAVERQQLVTQKSQAEARSQAFYVTVQHNPAAKTTALTSRFSPLTLTHGGTPRNHWIGVTATFPGEPRPGATDHVDVTVLTNFTGITYQNAKDITFTADGADIVCPVTDYKSKFRSMSTGRTQIRQDDETLVASLPTAAVAKLASAKAVTGTLGTATFALTKDQIEMFAAVARELKLTP